MALGAMSPENYVAYLAGINAFTCVVVGVRFWILRNKLRKISDWVSDALFVLAAAASCTNAFICMWKTVKEIEFRAANKDMDEQTITYYMFAPVYLKILFASATLYFGELWLMKGAFIAFYWSLFSRVQTRLKGLLYVAIVLTVMLFLAAMITHLAWCRPIQRNWTENLLDYAECASENSIEVLLTTSIANIITDAIVVILPLTIIHRLALGRLELYALGFVFLIGGLSITASVIRLTILRNVYSMPTVTLQAITQVEVWSVLELNVAFLAFTLPSLRKVISDRFGGLMSLVGRVTGNSSGGGTTLSKRSQGTVDTNRPPTVSSIPLQKREVRHAYISMESPSEEEINSTRKQPSVDTERSTENLHSKIHGVHAV